MKIKTTDWRGQPFVCSFAEFVKSEVQDQDRSGAVESAAATLDNLADLVGRLCETLAGRGLLTPHEFQLLVDPASAYGERKPIEFITDEEATRATTK